MSVTMLLGDCLKLMAALPTASVHGAILDPPFCGTDFSAASVQKLRNARGGVWRQPRKGRAPVPRIGDSCTKEFQEMMSAAAALLLRICLPGAHAFVACSPLHQHKVTACFVDQGWQMRGAIVRLVSTLRGGDRPKNAHLEFPDCTVLPRACYEPWLLVRKPTEGTVAENLRRYGVGALSRKSKQQPFMDVMLSRRTSRAEKSAASHPTVKPLAFIEELVIAATPFPGATIIDCFAGSGTTGVACVRTGRNFIGMEKDAGYFKMASERIAAEQAQQRLAI